MSPAQATSVPGTPNEASLGVTLTTLATKFLSTYQERATDIWSSCWAESAVWEKWETSPRSRETSRGSQVYRTDRVAMSGRCSSHAEAKDVSSVCIQSIRQSHENKDSLYCPAAFR